MKQRKLFNHFLLAGASVIPILGCTPHYEPTAYSICNEAECGDPVDITVVNDSETVKDKAP